MEKLKSKAGSNLRCLNPWFNLAINNNKIKVCTASKVVIGELTKDTSLKDFWNKKEIRMVRKCMLEGNLSNICHGACSVLYDARDGFRKFKKNRKRLTKDEVILINTVKQAKDTVGFHPMNITISMDHNCNLRCTMCQTIWDNPGYSISEGIYRLIDELSGNLKRIFFTGGEPFYSGRVLNLINYCIQKGYDFKYGFFTNGLCIDMDLLKRIHIDEIYISIDGAAKKTYEKIRVGASFERVMANLNRLLDYRREVGWFDINVMFVVMRSNFREIPLMLKLFEGRKVRVLFSPFLGPEEHPENIFVFGEHLTPLLSFIRSAMVKTKDKSALNSLKIVEHTVIKSLFNDITDNC